MVRHAGDRKRKQGDGGGWGGGWEVRIAALVVIQRNMSLIFTDLLVSAAHKVATDCTLLPSHAW